MNKDVLVETVRTWASAQLPGEQGAAERAANIALAAYEGGASVDEACRDARGFLTSWAWHPSHALDQRIPVAS